LARIEPPENKREAQLPEFELSKGEGQQPTQNMDYFLEQKENIVTLAAKCGQPRKPTFSEERQITKS
jgi:hypothetical protein